MPRKPEWIHRIAEIQAHVSQSPSALLDRSDIEAVFQVSSRQAARILDKFCAEQVGGAKVIHRDELLSRLRQIGDGEPAVWEQERRERLRRKLEEARWEARSRRIEIPTPPPWADVALPEEIRLGNGELHIRFSTPVELLQRLMLLARMLSENWDTFAGQGDLGGEQNHGGRKQVP